MSVMLARPWMLVTKKFKHFIVWLLTNLIQEMWFEHHTFGRGQQGKKFASTTYSVEERAWMSSS
jgi:hypothetical protein